MSGVVARRRVSTIMLFYIKVSPVQHLREEVLLPLGKRHSKLQADK